MAFRGKYSLTAARQRCSVTSVSGERPMPQAISFSGRCFPLLSNLRRNRRNAPQPSPEMPMMGAGAALTPGGAPPGNASLAYFLRD